MSLRAVGRKFLRASGYDIIGTATRARLERTDLIGSMRTAKSLGFFPRTIIDVGAARGAWSWQVAQVWSDAHFILIDPLTENELDLDRTCRKLGNAEYRIAAVLERPGIVTLHVHPDLDGSSVFLERETNINGVPRGVAAICLNDIVDEIQLKGPILLKADVQGAEMCVLQGANRLWPALEMIVIEVLLFDIFQGKNTQFGEMVSFMRSKGFVAWDIFGSSYRMLDNALHQVDMAFVRADGMFRTYHQYASPEQRLDQLRIIQRTDRKRLGQ